MTLLSQTFISTKTGRNETHSKKKILPSSVFPFSQHPPLCRTSTNGNICKCVYVYIYIHIVQYIQYLYKMQSHVSCGGGLGIGVSNFGLALLMTVVHLHEVSDLSVSVVCTYSCICIYAFLCIHAQFECESGHWSK